MADDIGFAPGRFECDRRRRDILIEGGIAAQRLTQANTNGSD